MTRKKQGFGLLEVIIGVSVISVALFSLATVSNIALKAAEESSKSIKAVFLLEEGMEAIRFLRANGWYAKIAVLNPGAVYYFEFYNNGWRATSTNVYIDGVFERSFVLQNVNRDSGDDIAASGGTLDFGTKKITVSASWRIKTATTTKSISSYITDLFGN